MGDPRLELTDDLDHWEVTLATGELLRVRAHGHKEEDGSHTFVALMRGQPDYEYELIRLPTSAVSEVQGGWPSRRE